MTKKMLSRKDEFRLADWCRSKGTALNNLTQAQATEMAAKDLGLELGPVSVRNIVADLGLDIKFKITRTSGEGGRYGEGIKARLARAEHLIAHLYAKLGETMPNA